jgi:PAS domain S-box-containing protein
VLASTVFAWSAIGAKRSPVNDSEYLIDTWETEDGLPENSATAMVQTPDGYLWFGTFSGLVRFDGLKFTVLKPENTPQLPGAGIVNLHVDGVGRMWLSTYRGVVMRERRQWRSFVKDQGWTGNYVRTFASRKNGDVLMTTFDGKVIEFANGRLNELPSPPGERGKGYFGYADEDGSWWVAQHQFIGRWKDGRWIEAVTPPPDLPAESVACASANDGAMLLLLGRELRRMRGGQEVSRLTLRETTGSVWSLSEDSHGNVWITTSNAGVCRVSPDGGLERWTTSNGLSHNSVRFVFEDRENNLWVGSSGGGLMRFKPRRLVAFGTESGLGDRAVTSVSPAPDHGLLIATFGQGIFRLNENGTRSATHWGWDGDGILAQSVLTDRNSRTWVGTYGQGLWIFDNDGARKIPEQEIGGGNVSSIFEDSRGRVWMGDGKGVTKWEAGEFKVYTEKDGLPDGAVLCFAESSEGTVWLSNLEGVFRLEGDRWIEVNDSSGAPLVSIHCLKADSGDVMWMGSGRGELLRWSHTTLDQIDARAGFAGRAVHGIIEDERHVFWMATNRGVLRASKHQLEAAANHKASRVDWQVLDTNDGMPSAECPAGHQPVCAQDGRGRLWFATLKGVAMVDPNNLRMNRVPPAIHIESISYQQPQNDRHPRETRTADSAVRIEAPFEDPIRLPPGSRRIEIHYAGLSFSAPEKVRFQVKVDGVDDDWIDVGGERVAHFYDRPPGTYIFRVGAANGDGVWSEMPASLAFSAAPFWWQTAWFRVMGAFSLMATAAGSVWLVMRARWRRAKERLANQLALEQSESRFLTMANAAPMMIWMSGPERLCTFFNKSWLEFTGRSLEQELGNGWAEGVHRDDYERCLRIYFESFEARRRFTMEYRLRRRDGVHCWVLKHGVPRLAADGRFLGYIGSAIDISALKHAEREVTRQRDELAHLSRVTLLGELSGALAHELNQPLTAILSNAQAAQRFLGRQEIDLGEVRAILDDIVSEDRRAGEVIHRLRLLLKKGEMQRQPLDANDLVQEVLNLLHSDLVHHSVAVEVEFAARLPHIDGDRVQLQQVLLNLVMNACDAMTGNNGDERRLELRTQSLEANSVRISACDHGPGIPAEVVERIFEPFFTTKPHGLGFGLSMCRTIVTAHGGRLWAENNKTRGATFHLDMPAIENHTL